MSLTSQDPFDLHRARITALESFGELEKLNRKMDKQIRLLEQIVEILTKIEERHTDADY